MAEDKDTEVPGRALDAAAFALLLEAYGANPARWPAARRERAEALLARADRHGATARRALTEAAAFERVLATPAVADAGQLERLAARIAAAAAEGPAAAPKANVIMLPAARARPAARPAWQGRWLAPAVLAASLLVGIVIGPGSTGVPALHEAADAIGLGAYVDQLALVPPEYDTSQDEDYL